MNYINAPRALCLYRVSTKHQVENNDIPMQRKECREFCQRKGWQLYREIHEKGISGYSISLDDRDAIREIKVAALRHEFDIFLVYMFDRIGRKEFEVPAFIRFLVDNGISVWSTQEGEQRFENDADSILAMLRSFTAQRESMKLSTRVRTKHMQMALAGEYRGGRIPFGYKTRESTAVNRKGIPIKELVIDEPQAAIVRMIFEKRVYEKKGVYEIAKMLCDMKIPGNIEQHWRASTVSYMLANRVYIGQLKFSNERSMPYEHLRIISNDLFTAAQSHRKSPKRQMPKEKIAMPEFYDLLYCAHCQGHLIFNAVHKVTTNEGQINTRLVYRCYNRLRYSSPCLGQTTYSKKRVDEIVLDEMYRTLEILVNANEEALVSNATEQEIRRVNEHLDVLAKEKSDLESDIKCLQAEMISATKQYGIEATTNLQMIITDRLSHLATLREQLIRERRNAQKRGILREKYTSELHKIRQLYVDFRNIPVEHLLEYAPLLFVRISIGDEYTIQVTYSPLINDFLL